jgi:Zn-dependent protease with chaperone function
MAFNEVHSFLPCISDEERRQRLGVTAVNVFLWIILGVLAIVTFGVVLLLGLLAWLVQWLLSEYQVRKLQALGSVASEEQFPEVNAAMKSVCEQFGVTKVPRVIIIEARVMNAFALRFAGKRAIVLYTELLEGIIDDPRQLRAILAHEVCHSVLDHGWRGRWEIYKPARYKAARELTCDNAACVAAGTLEAAKTVIKKLCAGKNLYGRLSEKALTEEAVYVHSGFFGWLLRQYMTHPPAGTRLANLQATAERLSVPAEALNDAPGV